MRTHAVAAALPRIAWLTVAALCALQWDVSAQDAPQTFRTRTTINTVEVRVVDRQGRPITDLTAADFSIRENGQIQTIQLFVPVTHTPAPGRSDRLELMAAGSRPGEAPATRRVFLIVLGRGNLQVPGRGLDGMIHLVRERLLPQDLVAVLAWNRATAFTAAHDEIAAMLERYEAGHQRVEALLEQHFSGLAAIYGSRDMPAALQDDIDRVLHATDTRSVQPDPAAVTDRLARQIREDVRVLQDSAVRQGRPSLDVFGAAEAERIGMTLDDYVSNSVQSLQDLTRIYAGLAYLRHVDGEKHLIYVSPGGLHLPSSDDDRQVARVAQDARVVIDIFHAGGAGAGGLWGPASSQNITELTGGQYTGVTSGTQFADRLDAATRSAYHLGYYPANTRLDGRHRRLEVRVNRRGAVLLYRRGYYARETLTTINRRDVIAQSRVAAALRHGGPVTDLAVLGMGRRAKGRDGRDEIVLQLQVDPGGVLLTRLLTEHQGSLDVAAFCADRQGYLVGQVWHRVELTLNEARFIQFQTSGVGFTVHVPLRRGASQCKAIIYDAASDRLGTVVPPLR